MATPASASFSVLPHDCVMRGRSGEDGRSGARSVAGINSNSGPRGWCRRVPRRRAVGRAPGRTVAPVSVRVSPGNGGGGDPSGLLGLRSAGHARSHDHAGRAAGGPLAGNPAPATIIRAVASPGRERAGEREGCRAHVADTRARSRVRSMRGPSRYVSEQTPSRKVAYHRARAGDHCLAAARVLRGSFSQRRENSLSCVPARCDFFSRKERASCGRSVGASERRCAGARRGTGPKTRVHASASGCVSRYAATRPCSPRNRPRSSGVFSDNGVFLWDNFRGASTAFCFGHMEHHYRLAQNIWRFDWAFALGLRTEVANCIFQPRNVCDLLLIFHRFGSSMVRAKARCRKRVGHRRYKLPSVLMTVP